MLALIGSKLADPNFLLQVIAVVVGGVLVLAIGTVLRWIGIPLKWWRRNRALRELVRKRREFLLVYNPQNGASKMLVLFDHGQIGDGKNDNENTWRIKRGCLEFVAEDGRLYSRFKLDQARGQLWGTADPDVRSLFGQYLLPQY